MLRYILIALCISAVLASPATRLHKVPKHKLHKGPRIINGQKAEPGQFPWQAALNIEDILFGWFCGGTIISEEWILTAGHCVDGAWFGEVSTGSTDVYDGDISEVAEFILHDDYDANLLANDIGLIRLSKPLTLDNNTTPLALSSDPLDPNTPIRVSGWGLTSDDGDDISEDLNYVDLVTITKEQCEETYGEGSILDEMVCANSDTDDVKSTCSGDSGGPVVANADTDPVHVAIVSFVSDQGCEQGSPSGYTRTAYYRDWIKEKTGI